MPRRCFAPFCKSRYNSRKEKLRIFSIPSKSKTLLDTWRNIIPRKDRVFTEKHYLCEKHFSEDDIITEWSSGGITIPLGRHRLKEDAIPQFFPDSPFYVPKKVKKRRTIKENDYVPVKIHKKNSTVPVPNSTVPVPNSTVPVPDSTMPVTDLSEFSEIKKENEEEIEIKFEEINMETTIPTLEECIQFNLDDEKSFQNLWDLTLKLPSDFWTKTKIAHNEKMCVSFIKYFLNKCDVPAAEKQILINQNLEIKYIIYGNIQIISEYPNTVECFNKLEDLLNKFDKLELCKGGPSIVQFPIDLYSKESMTTSYVDNAIDVWRHKNCCIYLGTIVNGRKSQCTFCKRSKTSLLKQRRRYDENAAKGKVPTSLKARNNNRRKRIVRLTSKLQFLYAKYKEIAKMNTTLKENLSEIDSD